MSSVRINLNPDLQRLWEAGYDLEVTPEAYLLVKNVPYVTEKCEIKTDGILVSLLSLNGDKTVKPESHEAFFIGEKPCTSKGVPIKMIIGSDKRQLTTNLLINHHLSAKDDYGDYYEKITRYISIISNHAKDIDDSLDARTFMFIEQDPETETVFNYVDTNSNRAEINPITDKLSTQKIAILGLGGTGSYILDFVAKTPVKEIHLFDADNFLQHNAFRAPGAPQKEKFMQHLKKVVYFSEIYLAMRKNIFPHPYEINSTNVEELKDLSFVFLSMDSGPQKKDVVNYLQRLNIPFVDCGLGMEDIDNCLRGQVRVTTSSSMKFDHVNKYISYAQDKDNLYDKNIQIADLNCLNAIMAVIKWKKLSGFYHDLDKEHHCTYVIFTNEFTNSETPN